MRLPKTEQDQTGTLDLMKVPSAPRAFETRSALSRRREGNDEKETGLLHKNASYTSLGFRIMRHEITLPVEDAYLD